MKTYIPKKTKYRKVFASKIPGGRKLQGRLIFGTFGLQATHSGHINPKQIEATRRAIHRTIKELGGRTWVRFMCQTPLTKKSLGSRMGRGTGKVDKWVCKVSAGRVLYEIDNVNVGTALDALKKGASKLPIKVRVIRH